jgi:acyl-coenzyme A synthetase/AMP-(fatty) acid ligase
MAPAGPLSLSELAETLARHAVTTLWLTAPLFRLMVETELQSFGGLRRLLTGGDVVTAEHAARFMQAFPGCKLIDGYGPTENTTFSCCYEIPSLETIRGGVPIGRPIANSNAYVLDAQLEPVPFGVPGELCVGGDGLARGYRNLPELTAERFVPDPFSAIPGARMYKTGDLARLRPEGVLEFLGRADHQVKINGHRVEIGEVEASLRAHPAVSASVVSVVEHRGEHVLLAHVTCVRNERTDERSLRKHLLTKLPRYMIPTRIAVIERLSEHNSGKIDRVAMAERAAQLLSGSNRPFQGMGGT